MLITYEKIAVLVGILTIILMLIGLYQTFRTELKHNTEQLINSGINNEKRHASHEKRIAINEQRILKLESILNLRLNEISQRVKNMSFALNEHIAGKS